MSKRSHKTQKSSSAKLHELVVVTIASDMEQAKDYETLLKSNDIPAMVKQQKDESMGTKQIVVMVPEEFADEAHVVIESQDAYDDFYDLAFDEDDDGDFDSDFFDDDF